MIGAMNWPWRRPRMLDPRPIPDLVRYQTDEAAKVKLAAQLADAKQRIEYLERRERIIMRANAGARDGDVNR